MRWNWFTVTRLSVHLRVWGITSALLTCLRHGDSFTEHQHLDLSACWIPEMVLSFRMPRIEESCSIVDMEGITDVNPLRLGDRSRGKSNDAQAVRQGRARAGTSVLLTWKVTLLGNLCLYRGGFIFEVTSAFRTVCISCLPRLAARAPLTGV